MRPGFDRRTEAFVVAWVVGLLGWPVFVGTERFVALLYDDGFYYAQIARHAAAGHGLTSPRARLAQPAVPRRLPGRDRLAATDLGPVYT